MAPRKSKSVPESSPAAPQNADQESSPAAPQDPKPKLTRLKKLQEREEKLKAEIQKILAREAEKEQKQETRRQLLIGKAIVNQIKQNKLTQEWLMAILDQELVKESDRLLFEWTAVAGEEGAIASVDSEPDEGIEVDDHRPGDSSALMEGDAPASVQESEVSVAPESADAGEDLAEEITGDREVADLAVLAGEAHGADPDDAVLDEAVEEDDWQSANLDAPAGVDALASVQESEISVAPESAVAGGDLAEETADGWKAINLFESTEVDGEVPQEDEVPNASESAVDSKVWNEAAADEAADDREAADLAELIETDGDVPHVSDAAAANSAAARSTKSAAAVKTNR